MLLNDSFVIDETELRCRRVQNCCVLYECSDDDDDDNNDNNNNSLVAGRHQFHQRGWTVYGHRYGRFTGESTSVSNAVHHVNLLNGSDTAPILSPNGNELLPYSALTAFFYKF